MKRTILINKNGTEKKPATTLLAAPILILVLAFLIIPTESNTQTRRFDQSNYQHGIADVHQIENQSSPATQKTMAKNLSPLRKSQSHSKAKHQFRLPNLKKVSSPTPKVGLLNPRNYNQEALIFFKIIIKEVYLV